MTSFGQAFGATELKEDGIEAYLAKPVKQSRLFDCMTDAMDRVAVQMNSPKTLASASNAVPLEASQKLAKVRILLAEDNIINQKVALGQ